MYWTTDTGEKSGGKTIRRYYIDTCFTTDNFRIIIRKSHSNNPCTAAEANTLITNRDTFIFYRKLLEPTKNNLTIDKNVCPARGSKLIYKVGKLVYLIAVTVHNPHNIKTIYSEKSSRYTDLTIEIKTNGMWKLYLQCQ